MMRHIIAASDDVYAVVALWISVDSRVAGIQMGQYHDGMELGKLPSAATSLPDLNMEHLCALSRYAASNLWIVGSLADLGVYYQHEAPMRGQLFTAITSFLPPHFAMECHVPSYSPDVNLPSTSTIMKSTESTCPILTNGA